MEKFSKTILIYLFSAGRRSRPTSKPSHNTQSRNLVNHPTPKPPPRNSQYRDTPTNTTNPLPILPTLPFTNTPNPLLHCTRVHRCLGCLLLPSCCTRRCPVCLPVCLSRSPPVHTFVYLSIHPFICLSVCLSVSLLSTHLPLSLWASNCMLFDRKTLRNCFISSLVLLSVS